eukprot:CAMPEP_0113724884 /NCGR_PEP_ID=MMETSP0038_2-20120614/39367_1 /TAXON_ID=2898 /ORGANISM="Cryptomonas paramecium" /LENGTH=97 /DNA_ID=CAMNT_0000654915 /DNA_START=9 /DNA_END=302 /DNA_ORIENTATION=- /assembly_acc=CAM_ASM_000170
MASGMMMPLSLDLSDVADCDSATDSASSRCSSPRSTTSSGFAPRCMELRLVEGRLQNVGFRADSASGSGEPRPRIKRRSSRKASASAWNPMMGRFVF